MIFFFLKNVQKNRDAENHVTSVTGISELLQCCPYNSDRSTVTKLLQS